jgi:hypothetical protein
MKLDPRVLVPAALALGALALPAASSADPTGMCPDHFTPTATFANPNYASKDNNGDFIVCHKDVPGQGDPTKDNRGVIISAISDTNPDNWQDDLYYVTGY